MTVYDDTTPVTMDGVDRATITFLRSDGANIVDDCIIDAVNNVITYDVPNSVTAVEGMVSFTIELYKGTDRITSGVVRFKAIADLDGGEVVSADPQYTVLENMIAKNTAVQDAEDVRVANENTRKTQETARVNAETVRQQNEAARLQKMQELEGVNAVQFDGRLTTAESQLDNIPN
jgi:hypothetical protein